MAIMRTCLCWKDLKVPSAVATTFTMAFSFIQIMLQIALWTTIDHMKEMLQILLVVLYLPLIVLDLLIIFSGIMLLVGLEKIAGLLCVISYFQRLRSEEAVLRGVANPYGGDGAYGTNWFGQPRYPFQNSTNYMPGPFKFTCNVDQNQLPGHEWTNDVGFAEPLVTGLERPGERHPVPVETQHPGYDGRLKYPYDYRSNPHFVTRRWYPYEQNWYQLPQFT
ncbi:hypothetical protein LSH36_510g03075 [Paralvinella palmiformis]|uniref:Transmembrane protein n=1 Tax=Paralvinella palmiformis TaxID=53620 RepID=A0AAD9MZ08_9ANNE|nr:hypothetical protein LSH36_510g03075 [Paralvinella palmiformis]